MTRQNNAWRIALPLFLIVFTQSLAAQEFIWQHVGSPSGAVIQSLSTNSEGRSLAASRNDNLYLSSGSDKSWRLLPVQISRVARVVLSDDDLIFATGSGGLYFSDDDGLSWTKVIDLDVRAMAFGGKPEPYLLFSNNLVEQGVRIFDVKTQADRPSSAGLDLVQTRFLGDLAFSSTEAQYLVVDRRSVWRRDNEHSNWRLQIPTGHIISRILVSPRDRIILATSNGMFEYKPSSDRLLPIFDNDDTAIVAEHATAAADGSFLVSTEFGELFRLAPDSDRWTDHSNYWTSSIRALQQAPDGTILLGTSSGVLTAEDIRGDVNEYSLGMRELRYIDFTRGSDGDFYVLSDYALYHSEDRGRSWRNTWHPGRSFTEGNRSLSVDHNDVLYLAEGSKLYYSKDKGSDWHSLGNMGGDVTQTLVVGSDLYVATSLGDIIHFHDFEHLASYDLAQKINKLVIHPDGELWALTEGGMYTSQDNGSNWLLSGLAGEALYDIVESRDSQWLVGGKSGLWRVGSRGETWNYLSVREISALHPIYGGFVALSRGNILFSQDGLTWQEVTVADPVEKVSRLHAIDGKLYALARDEGVYESSGRATFVNEALPRKSLPARVGLASNPITSSGVVQVELGEPGPLTIAVYSLSGELVLQRKLPALPAGRHSLPLAWSVLAPAAYILQLKARADCHSRVILKTR